ncbi:MAG: GNAT family N-acetyltransferase [Paludibacteraceae bacterium]|nr:GNAT family N-acetyltransferase [Paludibacteraceae bacterium]
MIEKQITALHASNNELKQLYETAFPVEEQIPWNDLMRLVETMPLDFTAYYDGASLLGFTIVYPRKTFNWFWYFAVPDALRGKGIGQQILSRLIDKYKASTNILDMESPDQVCENAEQRRRRHAFYLRNGFRDTGVGRSFDGIDYTILIRGEGTFTIHDYDVIINELRSFWDAMPQAEEA